MKVFTVGMDEKPPIKDNPVSSDGTTLTSTPIITLEKKRTSYKNYVMCLGTLFFIFLFSIIIGKLVYSRIPDDFGLPRFELKRRIGMGCDDCMNAGIIQSFYPQRPSRVFESSNNAAAPAALAMQAGQPQKSGQAASTTSTSQRFESGSSIDQPQVVDSRLDFLRKIIPKIKEQAEKSGIEGVMQVKVLQMDSFEPKQLLDGSDESQLQPVINAPQPIDYMASFRPTLLSDFLRWNVINNDERYGRNFPNLESQTSGNQFFGPQQDDLAKGGPMLVLGPVLHSQQLQLLPAAWDNNNNIAWSNPLQPRLFNFAQQISKQQQWPIPVYNKNSNEKVAQWQNIQWSNNHLPTPVVQQNPLPIWESGNQWQDSVQMGGNWQNNIQSGTSNPWAQNEWQGQGQGQQQQQQHWSQYPQTWQASMNQNNNDWNIQRANIVDNLDGRMTQAVLTSDNVNNYIYNNNANDQWIRYYNQWHTNNQRLQQQPIANTVVSQSLEVTGPVLPQQTQDQSPGQQQPQITDSQQSPMILEHQVKSLSIRTQQQKQQPLVAQQYPNNPIQSEINTVSNEAFQQSPSLPDRSEPDDSVPRTFAPLIFNNDEWKRTESSNLLVEPANDNQEQLQLLHQERPLPIHPIESGLSGNSGGMEMIDDELNKVSIMEQSGSVNDINRGLSNPLLFQVDEPPPQSVSMDESVSK